MDIGFSSYGQIEIDAICIETKNLKAGNKGDYFQAMYDHIDELPYEKVLIIQPRKFKSTTFYVSLHAHCPDPRCD